MKFNVITGLPRAGSTLLCNILNQNPNFYASSTSSLSGTVNMISGNWSKSVDVKNLLNRDKEKTEKRLEHTLKSFIEAWYKDCETKVVFDKSRGWSLNSLLLKKLYPESKIICVVRDLRNVYASIEKQHKKNPILDVETIPIEKTLMKKVYTAFEPKGLVGAPIVGILDMIRRKTQGVIFIKYENLSSKPEEIMKKLYEELEEEYFKHDFDNVKNTAIDPDGFYLYKYPHKGEGKIISGNTEEYKEYLSKDVIAFIMDKFQQYNKFFKYI